MWLNLNNLPIWKQSTIHLSSSCSCLSLLNYLLSNLSLRQACNCFNISPDSARLFRELDLTTECSGPLLSYLLELLRATFRLTKCIPHLPQKIGWILLFINNNVLLRWTRRILSRQLELAYNYIWKSGLI